MNKVKIYSGKRIDANETDILSKNLQGLCYDGRVNIKVNKTTTTIHLLDGTSSEENCCYTFMKGYALGKQSSE